MILNPYFKENAMLELLIWVSFRYLNENKSYASSFCFFPCSFVSLIRSRCADFLPYVRHRAGAGDTGMRFDPCS